MKKFFSLFLLVVLAVTLFGSGFAGFTSFMFGGLRMVSQPVQFLLGMKISLADYKDNHFKPIGKELELIPFPNRDWEFGWHPSYTKKDEEEAKKIAKALKDVKQKIDGELWYPSLEPKTYLGLDSVIDFEGMGIMPGYPAWWTQIIRWISDSDYLYLRTKLTW